MKMMVWEDLSKYDKVLKKVVNRWWYRLNGRWSQDELYNECVLAYHDIYGVYKGVVPEKEFVKLLFRSCSNRLYDMIVNKRLEIEIEKVKVSVGLDKFQKLFEKLWVEDVLRLLSEEGKLMVSFILDKEKVEEVGLKRRGNSVRNQGLCREDVFYYFRRELGWSWRKIWAVIREVRRVLRIFL